MKVLANDGISQSGISQLEKNGFNVITNKVEQNDLIDYINNEKIEVILVRSATQVRKDIIDKCSSVKIIGRGGVGMDNIDVEYAKKQGNTRYKYSCCIISISCRISYGSPFQHF
jgi:D-3-phosphoglycerate dehydrogenase